MNVIFVRLARFGTVLALAVVMLGAWVRLHDAGLGCPDWPGCYGKLVVPDTATAAQDPGFAARPLVAAKAWREMIHRYLAGTLVLVSVALGVLAWRNRADPSQPWRRPLALLGLIVFQALLGMASGSKPVRQGRSSIASGEGMPRVRGQSVAPGSVLRSQWKMRTCTAVG